MSADEPRDLTWEVEIRLFSRAFLGIWTLVCAITWLVVALILGTIFVGQRRWDALVGVLGVMTAACGGLWLVGLPVMALVYRGRSRVRYTLTEHGVRCETIDPAVRRSNRLAIAAGALSGSSGLAGAGLTAAAHEVSEAFWRGGFRAHFEPGRHSIALKGTWKTLFRIQCTASNYDEVASRVSAELERAGTSSRAGRSTGPGVFALRTALAVGGSTALFPVSDEVGLGPLVPILVLCFALASVWLLHVFGWVVLAGVALEAAFVLSSLPGSHAHRFRYGDGPIILLLGAAGVGLLVWLGVRAALGRWRSVLMENAVDLGT
jgi:hypothetical protein